MNEKIFTEHGLQRFLMMCRNFAGWKSKFIWLIILLVPVSISVLADNDPTSCGVELISVSSFDNTASDNQSYLDFNFLIKNTGTSDAVFEFTLNSIKPEENPDGSTTEKNVELQAVLIDSDNNPVTSLPMGSGTEMQLALRVQIPDVNRTGVWNCTQIVVSSSLCDTQTSVSYSTYIPRPEDGTTGWHYGYSFECPQCPISIYLQTDENYN